jgi:hypothetical protein
VVGAGILGATRRPGLPRLWRRASALGDGRPPGARLPPTANGAVYVDVYTPSIGRDACRDSGARWVEPLVTGNAAAPVHPNARGMDGMAAVVAAAINARA